MLNGDVFNKLAINLRVPAGIAHIAFPLFCWALVALRWCNIWLTAPWMVGVIVFYYVLAAAYLFFAFIVRMRITGIIGLALVMMAFLFVWVPYNWVLALLFIPVICRVSYDRDNKLAAIILTVLACISVLFVISASLLFKGLIPEKYAYHPSPDGHYIALEYAFTMIPSGTDVLLCRVNGLLLIQERVLYLANYSDFGGEIEWQDQRTILIYGEKMDVFNDPVLERYIPF